jgi:GxxExxY protein
MPIACQLDLHRIDQSAFKQIDYAVMGQAFAAHNEQGRLFDEDIYANLLTLKLTNAGLRVNKEVEIKVTHKTSSKSYYVDLIINGCVPYELKTTDTLHPKHHAQLLQYLHLLDLAHGKLINFRARSLEGRFASTTLTHIDRKHYTLVKENWLKTKLSDEIESLLQELFSDWGSCLSIALYEEALIHLIDTASYQRLRVSIDHAEMGSIKFATAGGSVGITFSAFSSKDKDAFKHLQRILKTTTLRQIFWININKNKITLETISAPSH